MRAYLCTSIGQAATVDTSEMLLDGQVVNVINTTVPIDDNNYDALICTRAANVNSSAKVCWLVMVYKWFFVCSASNCSNIDLVTLVIHKRFSVLQMAKTSQWLTESMIMMQTCLT